jgi:hypothetical protein
MDFGSHGGPHPVNPARRPWRFMNGSIAGLDVKLGLCASDLRLVSNNHGGSTFGGSAHSPRRWCAEPSQYAAGQVMYG